jgi:hypothetical protein
MCREFGLSLIFLRTFMPVTKKFDIPKLAGSVPIPVENLKAYSPERLE